MYVVLRCSQKRERDTTRAYRWRKKTTVETEPTAPIMLAIVHACVYDFRGNFHAERVARKKLIVMEKYQCVLCLQHILSNDVQTLLSGRDRASMEIPY